MNPFLDLFNPAPKPDRRREARGPNRRQSIRYRSDVAVVLGWWVGDECHSAEGALLDISQGGAAVALTGGAPPPVGVAHLRLSEGSTPDWAEVEVRSVRRSKSGVPVVHLAFAGGCSYALFRAALPGTFLSGWGTLLNPEEFETRSWR